VVAGGNGGRQCLTAATDEGGRWHLMVAMDGSCGSGGQERWCSMAAVVVAFDGDKSVRKCLIALSMEDEREVQEEATQQPAGMMRGQEGGATRGRREMLRQPAGATRL
jgi:hypothetical protein